MASIWGWSLCFARARRVWIGEKARTSYARSREGRPTWPGDVQSCAEEVKSGAFSWRLERTGSCWERILYKFIKLIFLAKCLRISPRWVLRVFFVFFLKVQWTDFADCSMFSFCIFFAQPCCRWQIAHFVREKWTPACNHSIFPRCFLICTFNPCVSGF